MDFEGVAAWRKALAPIVSGLVLAFGGAMIVFAAQEGWWATLLGAALVVVWIIALAGWAAIHRPTGRIGASGDPARREAEREIAVLRALLDQLPVPLIRQDRDGARALNRAARSLFATDYRIAGSIPGPGRTGGGRLEVEGRSWRITWVETASDMGERAPSQSGSDSQLGVLVDVDAEQRAADARASDEMVDILGHELLNGLSPVVSLADSASLALANGEPALADILGTLARRAEGLENFTRAYRALSRLPAPVAAPVSLGEMVEDVRLLFASRYDARVELEVVRSGMDEGAVDRDQMSQAVWALLQNAAEAALAAPGPHRVALIVKAGAEGQSWRVEDSGAGIGSLERTRIFRPFFTTKPKGSGIGLSLARKIARGHGGELRLLDCTPTAFELFIPSGAAA